MSDEQEESQQDLIEMEETMENMIKQPESSLAIEKLLSEPPLDNMPIEVSKSTPAP